MAETRDGFLRRGDQRRADWAALRPRRRELALALLARPDLYETGLAMLRSHYPKAPEDMLRTAAFHLYGEAPDAVLGFLAELEFALSDPDKYFHAALGSDVLYHLYNFLTIAALLPEGKPGLLELIQEARDCLNDDDKKGALSSLKSLEQQLNGSQLPPAIETWPPTGEE